METRSFGPTGRQVAVIGQGSYRMGDRSFKAEQEVEALRLGMDLGMTHIDTAEMYGSGRSERLIARAIQGRRDEVFLVSKVLPSNATYDGTLRACAQSLERLETDRLDLYLLHWPSRHPLRETMRALETLVDRGMIRALGVSNFEVAELEEAQRYLNNHPLACNQVLYHLGDRTIEHELIPYCAQHEMAVVAYSPYGQGRFPSPSSEGGRVLAAIAEKYERTPRQVALNCLTRHENVFTIPKASQPEHVRENAGGSGWDLDDDDIAWIDEAFPLPPPGSPLGML